MSRPVSRTLAAADAPRLRALFEARGHVPARAPKNRYVAFEVRTPDKSIFTLYTSGKFVCTLREGDAEGQVLGAEIDALVGAVSEQALCRGGARPGTGPAGQTSKAAWLAGADETGTGELLGCAIVGGALFPRGFAGDVEEVVGTVDTKVSRAASGWESLGEALAGLRAKKLVAAAVPVPNRLFDIYNKNQLLDLAFVRLVGDLLAGAPGAGDVSDLELVIDDFGTRSLLQRAGQCWRERGATVRFETRADDTHLAVRAASVVARVHRSREMAGLEAEVTDGPIGSGNAGHRATRAWLARRARRGGPWPSFVKTSFRTVRDLDGLPAVEKRPVPALDRLLDDAGVRAFLNGQLDGKALRLRTARGATARLDVDGQGGLLGPAGADLGYDFLPLLCGGMVLHPDVCDPDRLAILLDRATGLLSGWRVLVAADDPALPLLSRAHRAGIVQVDPVAEADPLERARVRAAALLTLKPHKGVLSLCLRA